MIPGIGDISGGQGGIQADLGGTNGDFMGGSDVYNGGNVSFGGSNRWGSPFASNSAPVVAGVDNTWLLIGAVVAIVWVLKKK